VAFLAVRTSGETPPKSLAALTSALDSILREVAPDLPVQEISTLEGLMARSVADRTLVLLPALGFAVVALAVALSGVFAVMARSVAERRRDFAIRKAIGATSSDIAAQVLRHAGRLMALGLGLGLALAFWSGQGLQALLYGIEPFDTMSLAGAALLILVTCAVAGYWPARRAAGIDPAEVLRADR